MLSKSLYFKSIQLYKCMYSIIREQQSFSSRDQGATHVTAQRITSPSKSDLEVNTSSVPLLKRSRQRGHRDVRATVFLLCVVVRHVRREVRALLLYRFRTFTSFAAISRMCVGHRLNGRNDARITNLETPSTDTEVRLQTPKQRRMSVGNSEFISDYFLTRSAFRTRSLFVNIFDRVAAYQDHEGGRYDQHINFQH